MTELKYTDGGLCSPKGFKAWGVASGIKADGSKDLALIVSDSMCNAAAVYTSNKVKGAPLIVTKEHLKDGKIKAVICNSGNANTCAPGGMEIAKETCALTAASLGIEPEDVAVASTGVIGVSLSIENFRQGIPELAKGLSGDGSAVAAEAIMTTDTQPKETAVEFNLGDKTCRIGGIAKGSGMINPNMATMLSFITTDANISSELLQKALKECTEESFNQISVDGDTSTNDMVIIMADGMSEAAPIESGESYEIFTKALKAVMIPLAKAIAGDGEGAGKLVQCDVNGAPDEETARKAAKSVISSNLLKAAVFGEDANWGRVLCALGNTDGDFSTDNVDVSISSEKGEIVVCKGSEGYPFSDEEGAHILSAKEVIISVNLNCGRSRATAWGCDLTYEYVKINGDYRS